VGWSRLFYPLQWEFLEIEHFQRQLPQLMKETEFSAWSPLRQIQLLQRMEVIPLLSQFVFSSLSA
jgi:hypothetical protein